jgi:xanthine dehydrogenase YagS FAD-binding subunit
LSGTALIGQRPTKQALAPLIEAAVSDARPLPHNAYKVRMARNAAVRALLMAAAQS